MKALVKPYLHFWRLGVVAFITFVLYSTVIKCLMTAAGLAGLLQGNPLLGILVTGVPFVVLVMPLFGWVFSVAMKQAHALTAEEEPAAPTGKAPLKIKGRTKSRTRSHRVAGAATSKA